MKLRINKELRYTDPKEARKIKEALKNPIIRMKVNQYISFNEGSVKQESKPPLCRLLPSAAGRITPQLCRCGCPQFFVTKNILGSRICEKMHGWLIF